MERKEEIKVNNSEATHLVWLSFNSNEKKEFFKTHHIPLIEAAVNSMGSSGEKGGVCMVCVVEEFTDKVSSLQHELEIRQVLNRAIGKT